MPIPPPSNLHPKHTPAHEPARVYPVMLVDGATEPLAPSTYPPACPSLPLPLRPIDPPKAPQSLPKQPRHQNAFPQSSPQLPCDQNTASSHPALGLTPPQRGRRQPLLTARPHSRPRTPCLAEEPGWRAAAWTWAALLLWDSGWGATRVFVRRGDLAVWGGGRFEGGVLDWGAGFLGWLAFLAGERPGSWCVWLGRRVVRGGDDEAGVGWWVVSVGWHGGVRCAALRCAALWCD